MNIRNGLVLTTAVAAALTAAACSPQADDSWTTDRPTAVCTDGKGNRVDDDFCSRGYRGGGGYSFIYLNSGSYVPRYGQHVSGGSSYRAPGATYSSSKSVSTARAAAVSRGGFGSSARASAGS